MLACASFILSSDGCVGPAFKLNSEVFCSLIAVKSSEQVNFVKSIFLLLYDSDTSVINTCVVARDNKRNRFNSIYFRSIKIGMSGEIQAAFFHKITGQEESGCKVILKWLW